MEYVLVYLVSCFFSFGVQTSVYYYYKLNRDPLITFHKSVLQYWSGVIGDGVLIPLANIFCWISLQYLGVGLDKIEVWAGALLGGVITTFIFHYAQQSAKSTNWTMPINGHWNLLGLYHAMFMFSESSFLLYTLINVLSTGASQIIFSPYLYVLLTLGIFFLTFLYDYRNVGKQTNNLNGQITFGETESLSANHDQVQ